MLTKQGALLGRAAGRRAAGRGRKNQDCSRLMELSGPALTGFVSGLSLTPHPDSGSFLAASAWPSQDGVQQGAFWEVVGHMAPPFDLS